jgi:two-component system, OmpR family, response regulator CpxR
VIDSQKTSRSTPQAPSAANRVSSVLLIDDDLDFCSLMAELLHTNGFHLELAHEGQSGLARATEEEFDLILLDVMLPAQNGYEVLRQLRKENTTPVILLTARTDQRERIAGLESGADDYICKPFNPRELIARARAVLRRTEQFHSTAPIVIEVGDVKLNRKTRRVWKKNREIPLTFCEFDILEMLLRSSGTVISRDAIATALYKREATPFERAIDVHISHLRKKFESEGEMLIRAVRGVGYMFSQAEEINK